MTAMWPWLVGLPALWLLAAAAVADALDRFVVRPRRRRPPAASVSVAVPLARGAVVARRFGASGRRPVIVVLPGIRGVGRPFERVLLAALGERAAIYFVAYPGQEGAPGRARLSESATAIGDLVRAVRRHAGCAAADMVFVGTCIGASFALRAAGTVRPRALVLVSLSLSPARMIRLYAASLPFGRLLAALVPAFVVRMNGVVRRALAAADGIPTTVFQGAEDRLAPLADLVAEGLPHWRLVAVAGAAHVGIARHCASEIVDTIRAALDEVESRPRADAPDAVPESEADVAFRPVAALGS